MTISGKHSGTSLDGSVWMLGQSSMHVSEWWDTPPWLYLDVGTAIDCCVWVIVLHDCVCIVGHLSMVVSEWRTFLDGCV